MNDTTLLKQTLGTDQFKSFYGYGHTAESAKIVRSELKHWLRSDVEEYGLKVSVRRADSGYGGPRVNITTNDKRLEKSYEYIIDENGEPSNSGKLVTRPVSDFTYGRPHHSAQLKTPEELEQLNDKIKTVLNQFGKCEDDAMTDYFNNTQPLFYGVSFEKETR